MKGKLLHRIPFFAYYDFIFIVILIFTHNIDQMQFTLASLFWMGFVFTQIELAVRILLKYDFLRNATTKFWLSFSFMSILLNIFVFTYYSIQKTIYFWDSSLYWVTSIDFTKGYYTDFVSAIKSIYYSINNSDYNLLPTLIISLPMRIFGFSYKIYTLAILNCYLLPTLLLTILLIRKVLQNNNMLSKLTEALSLIIPFLFTPFLIPLMNGFLDSAGMPYIVLLFMIIYSDEIIDFSFLRNVSFYLFMLLLIFTRRWYAFFSVGFLISFFIVTGFSILWLKENKKWKYILKFILNMGTIGLLCLATILLIFKGFFIRSLFNNYAMVYSAYQQGNALTNLKLAGQYFGLLIIIVSIVGILALLFKKTEIKFFSIICLQLLISFFLFVRIQSFSNQHYYIMAIQICILFTIGICWLGNFKKKIPLVALFLIVILFIINFTQTFIPILSSFKETKILSNVSVYPQVRSDIKPVKTMISDLDSMTNNNAKKVYLLSSSFTLNSSIVMNAFLPERENALPALLQTHDVDLRDGFPNMLFLADYILVANPIQYHLRADDQEVVGMLADLFLNNQMTNFKQVKTYHIENGVSVILFKKIKPYESKNIRLITNHFQNKYPDNPMLQVNSLLPYIQENKLGVLRNNIQADNSNIAIINSGREVKLSFSMKNKFHKLSFKVISTDQKEHIQFKINTDSEKDKIYSIDNKNNKSIEVNLSHKNQLNIFIQKSNGSNSQVELSDISLK